MDANAKVRDGLYQAALVGLSTGCTDYVLNLNRGQAEVTVTIDTARVVQVAFDLYSHLVNTRSPLATDSLNVNPKTIKKIYFHTMQTNIGSMVIGILTDKNPADIEIEHVK